jgi:uncharacterized protein YrrD
MATHEIRIGAPVHSSDGKHLGHVHRLVVDADSKQLAYVAIDKSIFTEDRLVEVSDLASSDEAGVRLAITAAEAETALRPYVAQEMVQTPDGVGMATWTGSTIGIAGSSKWNIVDSGSADFPSTTGSSLFMQAPIGTVITQEVSNLEPGDVRIDTGTDVVGSDGHKVGHVDELLFDDENKVTGFVVRAGFLFKHDVQVPITWVAGIAHDHIRLNLTKDEAEAKGGPAA